MPYDSQLADRVRNYLSEIPQLQIEEKEMFSGLAFLVNDKMCINVSGDELMCRFDPDLLEQVAERPGFRTMIMKGKELKGYGYVDPVGFQSKQDFEYWINLCIDYNDRAKSSKKKKR
ncbi:TfoX/Sxy family protein [Desertivirga brevis]|uniref:TfoX/Sxy family protein n=1 Tax=Desertivirga brevis TaxID=2810310 RepID=UPI001A962919|nr:TfoX/Sxy family protein [Pedobacter sp. SYSU D00873]